MLQGPVRNTAGPGVLPTLKPRIASWTSVGMGSLGSLEGAKEYARIASLITSMIAGIEGSFTGWNWASKLSARASAFLESERTSPPGVTRVDDGVEIHITCLVIFHSDWSSGSRFSKLFKYTRLNISFHSNNSIVRKLRRNPINKDKCFSSSVYQITYLACA